MLRRVASQVSLRSRKRKLELFLALFEPGPGSSVVDVGVTNAAFGGGSSDNFFEALYPWPERVTAYCTPDISLRSGLAARSFKVTFWAQRHTR